MPENQMGLFGGDWTEKKLSILKKYLEAYVTALSRQPFELLYIDAFAGTGYREVEESGHEDGGGLFSELADQERQMFLDGSARIALKVKRPFHKYLFIEKSARKCGELRNLKWEFGPLADRIQIENSDCNSYLRSFCRNTSWVRKRAVLFLDPFGMQVEWDTVQVVAQTHAIDTWILFPLGVAVSRLLKKDGNIPDKWRTCLTRVFGTDEWYDVFYQEVTRRGLLGDVTEVRKLCSFDTIARYYNDRLGKVFLDVAPNPAQLMNSRGNPLFLFCFAAGNQKGAPIAVEIAQQILKGW